MTTMTEESFFSMWSTIMTNWFTPTTLFLVLNLTIGTIVVSSKFSKKNPTHNSSPILQRIKSVNFFQYAPESSNVAQVEPTRTGSILERVKSFNFSFNPYNSEPERENYDQSANSSDPEGEFQHGSANNSEPDRDSGTDSPTTRDELIAHRGAPAKKKRVGESPAKKEIAGEVPSKSRNSGEVPASKKIPGETPVKKMMRSASEKMRFWRASSEEEKGDDDEELRRPATVRGGEGSETLTARDGECVDSQADDFINKFRQQLKLQRLDSMLRYSDMITRGSSR